MKISYVFTDGRYGSVKLPTLEAVISIRLLSFFKEMEYRFVSTLICWRFAFCSSFVLLKTTQKAIYIGLCAVDNKILSLTGRPYIFHEDVQPYIIAAKIETGLEYDIAASSMFPSRFDWFIAGPAWGWRYRLRLKSSIRHATGLHFLFNKVS